MTKLLQILQTLIRLPEKAHKQPEKAGIPAPAIIFYPGRPISQFWRDFCRAQHFCSNFRV